jgi:DNA replication protein DnaC
MILRVPQRFRGAKLDGLDEDQFRMVVDFAGSPQDKGLLLAGPPGIGKTWAMAALTRWWKEHHGQDYEFITAPDMFDRYVVGAAPLRDPFRGYSYNKTFETTPWLVINDLGKEYRGGKLHEQAAYKLGRILRARSERELLTHITTNLKLKGTGEDETLSTVYGSSITSLLSEMVRLFEVQGSDQRKSARR